VEIATEQQRRVATNRNVEHHKAETQSEVDGGSSESRVEDREVDPGRRESSTGSDVSSSSEVQVGENRVGVDLSRKDLRKE